MPTIIVEVMPKPAILDPQGKAVTAALARLGDTPISAVRIGKRFELSIEGPVDASVLEHVRGVAEDLLANTVIEDVVFVGEA